MMKSFIYFIPLALTFLQCKAKGPPSETQIEEGFSHQVRHLLENPSSGVHSDYHVEHLKRKTRESERLGSHLWSQIARSVEAVVKDEVDVNRRERQRRETILEKWANKGASVIEQGSAGVAVGSQLTASMVQMGAEEAAGAVGEAAGDTSSMFSEGVAQAGAAVADAIKSGSRIIPGK